MADVLKICPHCGARLPEEASFCPHCAQSVKEHKEVLPPRRLSRRALYSALASLLILALAVAGWLYTRPKVYDNGTAEVIYTNSGATYRVLAGWINDRFNPAHQVNQPADVGTCCTPSPNACTSTAWRTAPTPRKSLWIR